MTHDLNEPRDRGPYVGPEPEADSNTISPLPGEPGIPNVATRQRMAVSTKGLLAVVLLIGSLVAVAAFAIQRFSASGKSAGEAESKLVKDKPTAATSEPRKLEMPPAPTASAAVAASPRIPALTPTADDLAEHYRRALHLKNGGEEEDVYANAPDDEDGEGFNPLFDFLTGDLSFISLTLVLPAVVRLLKADGHLLMLVKPQFELQPGQIGKGGIVRDPVHFEFVEKRLRDTCAGLGVDVLAWLESPIAGGDGNREFFIHAQKGHNAVGEDQPLVAAPARNLPKRTPRSEQRALHAAHEDSEEAHAGQHGPARSKRRVKPEQD